MTDSPHDEPFRLAAPAIRHRLAAIQAEVERRVPDAERCFSYRMPAFRRERVFFFFAAFKHHIGIYPPVNGPADLVEELAPYRGPKGNLAFPHANPLPVDLIGRIAEALAAQDAPRGPNRRYPVSGTTQ